ncbi:MAG: GNAT family N-acetyltransferase [Actinobacteria bacterium]|nr:GNAT family N-acetyltransferase [Actinomycetota bacterium]
MPTLRDATPADALAIAGVQVRAWQAAYRGLIDDEFLDGLLPEDRANRYRLGDEDPMTARTVLAEAGGEVLGFARFGLCRDDDARTAGEIYALYVDPSRWRTGTGRLLLDDATDRFRADGFEVAVLWVLRGNEAAERFYESAGWRRDGAEREEQPYGVVSNVLRMRRSLVPARSQVEVR